MNRIIKIGLVMVLMSLGFLVFGGEKAEAATATCLTTHAGFCSEVGLTVGVATSVDFDDMKEALEDYYSRNSKALGWSYMKYKSGYWYWVCVNEDIIRFSGVPAPCTPKWGSYGDCDAECDGGTQTRTQTCTGDIGSRPCNTQPCCGVADRDSYEKTSEVVAAGRCDIGDIVNNWVDNSGLAAQNGKAWTWNCNDGSQDSDECLAYKEGECGYDAASNPDNPPYSNRGDACRFGALNSAKLVDGILYWKCGTGEADKNVGNFFSNRPGDGAPVPVDYYGPASGGVDCHCIPRYEYDCVGTGTYIGRSCTDNCGGTMEENVQAIKRDVACFVNESLLINKDEYYTATGKHCVNNTVQCAPCGTQDSEGGNYHETN